MLALLVLSSALLAGAAPAPGLVRAERLIDDGKLDEAQALLEPLVESEPRALVLMTALRNATRDPAAVESGKRAVELLVEDAEAHYRYAEALRIKMASGSKLTAMFSVRAYKRAVQRAIELDPGHVLARREEIGYLSFAPAIGGGDRERAQERIAALMPIDRPVALACRAELRVADEDYEGARDDFRAALAERPGDDEARMHLALVLYRLGSKQEAGRELDRLAGHGGRIERLRTFVEAAPDDARSRRFRAAARDWLGELR
jgi:predicted Zn-dependent protease